MRKNVFLNRTYFGDHHIYTIGQLGPVTQIGDYYFELIKEGRKLRLSVRDLKLKEVFTRVFRKNTPCDQIKRFAEAFARHPPTQKRPLDSMRKGFWSFTRPLREGGMG